MDFRKKKDTTVCCLPKTLLGSNIANVLKVKVCEKTTHTVTKESLLAMLISDKIK